MPRPSSRRVAGFIMGLALLVGGCGLALGIDDLPIPSNEVGESGALESGADVARPPLVPDEGGTPLDAGADVAPPETIPVLGGAFDIDATEITNAAYTRFLAALAVNGVDAGTIAHPSCGWNTAYRDPDCLNASLDPQAPATCVDWCDAWAYCAWSGRRLCGAITGGALASADREVPSKSQWLQACGGFGQKYPYGGTLDPVGCASGVTVDAGRTSPVRSFPKCQGATAGLFDMAGNASEWDDSCDSDAGADGGPDQDLCFARGGSFVDSDPSCQVITRHPRSRHLPTLGFRCCSR